MIYQIHYLIPKYGIIGVGTYVWHIREGTHCSLYPPPPHTIHPPLADLVLGDSVNCISEVPDTRNSAN